MYKDIIDDVELPILIDISTALRIKHEEICKIVKTHRLKYIIVKEVSYST